MFRKLIAIFILSLFLFSCDSTGQKGYMNPKLQKSENLAVVYSGFTYEYKMNKKIDMRYYISIKFPNQKDIVGKYLILEFQDPVRHRKVQYNTETFLIRPENKSLSIKSKIFYGFKQKEYYPINVKLSEDKNGEKIIESFTQYAWVEFIPQGYINEM